MPTPAFVVMGVPPPPAHERAGPGTSAEYHEHYARQLRMISVRSRIYCAGYGGTPGRTTDHTTMLPCWAAAPCAARLFVRAAGVADRRGLLRAPALPFYPGLSWCAATFLAAGLTAQATPGIAASAPPTSTVPTASPLASSSKEPSLFVWRLSCSLIRPILS